MATTTKQEAGWREEYPWMETVSGKHVSPVNTDLSQIDIDDIAHGLSLSCRWAGQCDIPFTIAQHSMGVATLSKKCFKLQGLLHDATEAYLTDIPTPFKPLMPEYKKLEASLWKAIAERFGVPEELHESVKLADRIMLMSERDVLKRRAGAREKWAPDYEDAPRKYGVVDHLVTWNETWEQSKAHYLEAFYAYGGRNN